MSHGASPLAAFHLIGDLSGLDPAEAGLRGLRPALFGRFNDLSGLRYDYPVVLARQPVDGVWVKSLADVIDGALRKVAPPGSEGEELRSQVLSHEQAMRTLLAGGQKGTLSLFWEAARRQQMKDDGAGHSGLQATHLERVREVLSLDGELAGCDQELAAKFVSCAWRESERWKAERLCKRINRLAQKLSDILQADFMQSPAARSAERLQKTMGSGSQSVFDFQAMARILQTAPVAAPIPQRRRERIEAAITVLRTQRFVAEDGGADDSPAEVYGFDFDDCQQAMTSFRERLPGMAALVRAISIAELEIENHYVESRHDGYFSSFDEQHLGPGDLALFPSYLVRLDGVADTGLSEILQILRAGLPFKIVAQTQDILDEDAIAEGRLSFGLRGQQLARMAVGLDNVFILQAATSSLYRLRDSVMHGVASDRPALFSVYGGMSSQQPDGALVVPPYLLAAAATESRAFPCFVFDPAAGRGLAVRCHLDGNPQVFQDWPEHTLAFEDADHTTHSVDLLFTLVDFIAAHPHFADRFACVPPENWSDEMVPAGEFFGLTALQRADKVPYILLLDRANVLHRAIFDDRLADAAWRCRDAWHSLQELGGIDNSHVAAALAIAEKEWASEKARLSAAEATRTAQTGAAPASRTDAEPAPPPAAAPEAKQPPAIEAEAEPASDDPWIETIRCTTCNECTQINDRMFAYNADKRAYVADPDAGTYRELVEAAETCQVAIIHPGKPRNPDEPGLEELLRRAAPFL